MSPAVTRADAIVVGAGVMGGAIALELARRGLRVVVVDKGGQVGGGSTSASAAVIRFSFSTFEGVASSWEAKQQWASWRDHLRLTEREVTAAPLARFHQVGMLFILPPGYDRSHTAGHYERVGVPNEILDAAEIAARFPALDVGRFHPPRWPDDPQFYDDATGGIEGWWTPDAGFVNDAQLAALNLIDAARRLGAEVRLRTEVTAVRTVGEGDRVGGVTFADGSTLDAPIVVNAAGPWSSGLNVLAGVEPFAMATRPLRQEINNAPAPTGFGLEDGGVAVGDLDLGTYFRPQPGGTMLVGGVEAECDPLVWDEEPDAATEHVTPELWEAQVLRLARRLPALKVPHRPSGVVSHYDVTPDWVPVYDRTNLDGFYVAIGTSGNQFKNAPLVGQLMAHLIDACESGHDHDTDPVKFRCEHTRLVLDLGHYARNRTPAATTGTVSG